MTEVKSKEAMKVLLENYFTLSSRVIKYRLFSGLIENPETLYERLLGKNKETIDETSRIELIEYLKLEMIINTVQLLEDLVRILQSYKFSVDDPVVIFRKRMGATGFYDKEITEEKLTTEKLLDYLSLPKFEQKEIENEKIKQGLSNFKKILLEAKTTYEKYLNLYTCYKHGNRVAVMISYKKPETGEDPYAVIAYLHEERERNSADVINLGDISETLKLNEKIFLLCNSIKENWFSVKSGEKDFTISLPNE